MEIHLSATRGYLLSHQLPTHLPGKTRTTSPGAAAATALLTVLYGCPDPTLSICRGHNALALERFPVLGKDRQWQQDLLASVWAERSCFTCGSALASEIITRGAAVMASSTERLLACCGWGASGTSRPSTACVTGHLWGKSSMRPFFLFDRGTRLICRPKLAQGRAARRPGMDTWPPRCVMGMGKFDWRRGMFKEVAGLLQKKPKALWRPTISRPPAGKAGSSLVQAGLSQAYKPKKLNCRHKHSPCAWRR
jgi:hypothetical protein